MIDKNQVCYVYNVKKDVKLPLWTVATILNRGGMMTKIEYVYNTAAAAYSAHGYLSGKADKWVEPDYRPNVYIMNNVPQKGHTK